MLLKSDFSPHWFKEESHDGVVRQTLKTWASHVIRMKACAVSSYNERSILDWRRRTYGEKNNIWLFDTQRIETKNVACSYSLDSSFQRLGF